MKLFAIFIALLASSAKSQEILEVTCGQDEIVVGFYKQAAPGYHMEDLHFNDINCNFDYEKDGYYMKSMNPLSACGTYVVTNDTHATFLNSISATHIVTPSSLPRGIINPAGELWNYHPETILISMTYKCTYEIDVRLSSAFIPNYTMVFLNLGMRSPQIRTRRWVVYPDVQQRGIFQVAMGIYKTAAYREAYTGGVPTLQPQETVFVGISMVGSTSSDLFILIRHCWATVVEDPESEPYYDLIVESCPVESAVKGTVKVTQNGIGHHALWQTEVFKLILGNVDYKTTWLHCDITICIQEFCPADCSDWRRRKRSIHKRRSIAEKRYTMSSVPLNVNKRKKL